MTARRRDHRRWRRVSAEAIALRRAGRSVGRQRMCLTREKRSERRTPAPSR